MNARARLALLSLLLVPVLLAAAPRDKSKPVRAELTACYDTIAAAYHDRNAEPVLSLRTPDFHTVMPNGDAWDPRRVVEYTRASFAQVETTLTLTFALDTIDVRGDTAEVALTQHWRRRQQKAGALRLVDTSAHQHEYWVRTAPGWRLCRIDHVQPGAWFVDGQPWDPAHPFVPPAAKP